MLKEHTTIGSPFSSEEIDLLEQVDLLRLEAGRRQGKNQKAEAGQFFTPASLARFMASLLKAQSSTVHILDAGAGVGSLFAACIAELSIRQRRPKQISIVAYETDADLLAYLRAAFRLCQQSCKQAGILFTGEIIHEDFIAAGVELLQDTLFSPQDERIHFNCAILNPPYKKIQSQSRERKLLQKAGIEASNLYAGFLALATQLLAPSGELIAITPRSFCNGPYFKHFREQFLQTMTLHRLHVFDSRKQAFSDDDVLQENIILRAVKDKARPEKVLISSSSGPDDEFMLVHEIEYTQVIHPDDPPTIHSRGTGSG